MAELPAGTVAFLLTYIENGGAALWLRTAVGARLCSNSSEGMRQVLARHDRGRAWTTGYIKALIDAVNALA
jgi:hypothetical protein